MENANILVRDEAVFHQTNAKQISDPFGVLGIILVALYSLDLLGGRMTTRMPLFFQNVEDRNPLPSSGFHADVQTIILMEPIGEAV